MQLQSDIAASDGNSTSAGSTLKLNTSNPLSTKPTEQQADLILKLMLANLDHCDVRSIAQKLLPEYAKSCATSLDCDDLHSAMRRLYLKRYSELQLALHRMDKLGLLLRRVQYLAEQNTLNAGATRLPVPHDGHHRQLPATSPVTLKPPALKRVERRMEMMGQKEG
jgi:hypothetical protein